MDFCGSRLFSFVRSCFFLVAGAAATGCVAPQTQLGSVSQDLVVVEQARQQQFVLQETLMQRIRVLNVASPLLRAAVPFCGDKVRPFFGWSAGNAYLWEQDYFRAARSLGYGDSVVILNVTPGMAAAKAGLSVGDRIVAINGVPLLIGKGANEAFALRLKAPSASASYSVSYMRGDSAHTVLVKTERVCAYTPRFVQQDDVNAFADGESIFITAGILRFFPDDAELSVVVAHEIAHDAMRHLDAQRKNKLVGGLLGAVVDIAAATSGVNTRGEFTKVGMDAGSVVFSQDFEREADYVGLYILALSDQPIANAPIVWRRLAAQNPRAIKFASSHPTTAERFVRLRQWQSEIERKTALGLALRPEMKGTSTMLAATKPVPEAETLRTSSTPVATKAAPVGPSVSPRGNAGPAEKAAPTRLHDGTISESTRPTSPFKREARDVGTATIGAPSSEAARSAAIESFSEGRALMGTHQWKQAETRFRETLLLDGSRAEYHAALGEVLMVQRHWLDAEAAYTAAMLLDVDNPAYRRRVKEARSHR